ncbi:hypothetical protein [Bowmanella pacifica]|uniref:Uncharacterized protein n=1 Tax=Bowmanella pacifica TaxID=502051 RepID=A0A917YTU8_9ALTE|nr:hypothetical protein [Bowmanella pacifica]GGO66845.1 hypothetical protein GCM10010982_11990 [Bowmanella pacifica]
MAFSHALLYPQSLYVVDKFVDEVFYCAGVNIARKAANAQKSLKYWLAIKTGDI